MGYSLRLGIRQVLCAMVLLSYHLLVVYVLSYTEGDLGLCENILKDELKLYPEGAWFLLFKGRLEFMKGNVDDAIAWYTRSWKSQDQWSQFHHICYWELMWANCCKQDWSESSEFARKLLTDSRWSRCVYGYQRASMLCMMQEDLSEAQTEELISLMKDVPGWKQRIAGKSLPIEKFAVKKSERFFAQGKKLVLPALELLYVWNMFKVLGKQWRLIEAMFKTVERTIKTEQASEDSDFKVDNKALLLLLKGACLRGMGSPLQAEECLREVVALEKQIRYDEYLVPFAVAEMGFMYLDMEQHSTAAKMLEDAKNNYKGYSLESRLHFRIHSALQDIHELKAAAKSGSSSLAQPESTDL